MLDQCRRLSARSPIVTGLSKQDVADRAEVDPDYVDRLVDTRDA